MLRHLSTWTSCSPDAVQFYQLLAASPAVNKRELVNITRTNVRLPDVLLHNNWITSIGHSKVIIPQIHFIIGTTAPDVVALWVHRLESLMSASGEGFVHVKYWRWLNRAWTDTMQILPWVENAYNCSLFIGE